MRGFVAGAVLAAALSTASVIAQQQQVSVAAAVDENRVYVGQAFLFQIQVQGSDTPDQPDIQPLKKDFSVQDAGGGANNSQSISIVNGRMSRVTQTGYNFNYRLSAKRQGVLTIPAVAVKVNDRFYQTTPLRIEVSAPQENKDFKLRMRLSENKVYVGQPVVLTTTWYVGSNVDQFVFNVPLMEDDRFELADPHVEVDPARQGDYLDILLGDRAVVAKKGRTQLDRLPYITVAFDKVVIPKQPGKLRLPASTVSFRAMQSSARRQQRSVFDDFFGDSLFNRRGRFQNFAIPSNRPSLQVLPLPEEGRPQDFSGLIGDFALKAEAEPLEVGVGEPITLTLKLSGPKYMEYVKLPPLGEQAILARNFKIPAERSPGEVVGPSKVFTQTIRARRAQVAEIPPVEISYFNPKLGQYAVAKSEPIPVRVTGSRMITALDAEGLGPEGIVQAELESLEGGIAYNYEDPDALDDQAFSIARLGSAAWIAALAAPPLGYLALLGWTFAQRRGGNPAARRAQRAWRQYDASLKRLALATGDADFHARLLAVIHEYLGAKLGLPAAALTFADVRARISEHTAADSFLPDLETLFRQCEAGRYAAGAFGEADPARLITDARSICEQIEKAPRRTA